MIVLENYSKLPHVMLRKVGEALPPLHRCKDTDQIRTYIMDWMRVIFYYRYNNYISANCSFNFQWFTVAVKH